MTLCTDENALAELTELLEPYCNGNTDGTHSEKLLKLPLKILKILRSKASTGSISAILISIAIIQKSDFIKERLGRIERKQARKEDLSDEDKCFLNSYSSELLESEEAELGLEMAGSLL